jgi:bifunctional DNase/RNase
MLFYLSGLSYAETASLLGIGIGAVRTRLHKARTTLQKTLWTTWLEDEMVDDGTTEMVEMHIRDVWQTPADGNKPRKILVVLEETGGERRFTIWIGRAEGEALAAALEQMEMPRPMTYAFMATLLEATGAQLQEVRISRLAESTFFAEVVVEGPAGRHTIDARPSDALNLAARTGTPIRAAAEVIAEAGQAVTWEEACRKMQELGVPPEHLPSQEEFEQINKVVRGETSGGAAAILAELRG